MKKEIIICLVIILTSFLAKAQTNADCINSIPLCATPSFTFYPVAGDGLVIDIPTGNNISNPQINPNPPNAGCLLAGENVPQWLLITVGNSGLLEFVFGAGNSPNPQIGFYDWAMWPYSPTACQNIQNNTLPPIRCNWNATSQGGTGIASPTNMPPGGNVGNYEAPLPVNACQQFIICISNFSGVNTLVSFQSLGTASLQCNPNCNASYSICAGKTVTITASNFANLTGASYSLQPGGQTNNTGTFVVTPLVTTTYTTYVTGLNQAQVVQTTTGVTNVTVNPSPLVAPTTTQAICGNTLNAVNLGLTWSPAGPAPGYTVVWNPIPPGILSPTQTTASGLPPGVTNVTVLTASGCSVITSFTMSPVPSPANFTITPPGNPYALTCTNTLIALSCAPANYTYTWISLGYTTTGAAVNFTPGMQGNYTVTSSNGIASCNTTQTVSIIQNTVAPTNSVNPTSQAITCNSGSPITFSGSVISPTSNIQHDWYSPLNPFPAPPIATSNNTLSILSGMVPPGIYTLVTTNLVNGCTTQKTVTITSLSAWPTFSLASPTNFSIGCAPLNQTTLTIVNAISTQTPPATCSFTFLPPSFAGVVTPSVILGPNAATITTIPGTWTIIVQDNSNWCRSIITVPVIQNTVAPHVFESQFTPTLTCRNPTVLATGTSTTPNTVVTWLIPQNPPTLSTPTCEIGPLTGPNISTTSLIYANYTVVATNTLNGCISTSVIPIFQNFKPPISSPTISIATPTAIYCSAKTNPAILTTGNSTTTSGGGPTAFVANPCWAGPSPQTPTCGPSTYSCFVTGIYTLTIEDNYNGCLNSGTVQVLDRTQPPIILNPVATSTLDCGKDAATLYFVLTTTTTGGTRNLISRYPPETAFSPPEVILYNINPNLSGTSSNSATVSKKGEYVYVITNTLTGCKATGTVNVVDGSLNSLFEANPATGYAPLTVNFTNNSFSSLGSGSIVSVWSFGNGSTNTNSTNAPTSALYNAPGIYTVMLLTTKGVCIDTTYKIIKVDMPSKMEVPNIFTPNGDGSNDVFFLMSANLGEITALIMDRWGNKVYETKSFTGNIAWDGKNLNGKDCASGVYFYVIKAKGTDDKAFEQKGNVSLFR